MSATPDVSTPLTRQWVTARAQRGKPLWRRYALSRTLQGVVVILGAAIIGFVLTSLSGNPADTQGANLTPAQVAALARDLGYNRPLLERLGHYFGRLLHGDLGTSFRTGAPAAHLVFTALPYTAALIAATMGLCLLASVPAATYSALHEGSRLDRFLRTGVSAVQGVPEFAAALGLIYVFGVQLRWLPTLGYTGPDSVILPALALSVGIFPAMTRVLRGQLLDLAGADFMTALRAKGMSERQIMIFHGLRNAAPAFVTLLALQLGWLVGGTLIVEAIFSWPGIGNLLYVSVQTRDLAVIQAIVLIVAIAYVAANLVADLVVLTIDPRIRSGR